MGFSPLIYYRQGKRSLVSQKTNRLNSNNYTCFYGTSNNTAIPNIYNSLDPVRSFSKQQYNIHVKVWDHLLNTFTCIHSHHPGRVLHHPGRPKIMVVKSGKIGKALRFPFKVPDLSLPIGRPEVDNDDEESFAKQEENRSEMYWGMAYCVVGIIVLGFT